MRTITIPPGIGDGIWLFMKLISTTEKFKVIMSDGQPQRGHQLAEILPQIIAQHQYAPGLAYSLIAKRNITQSKRNWKDIKEQSFYLSANTHVEAGKRIEKFLPDLPTNFKLDYTTSKIDQVIADQLLPKGKSYIGIYTSAYSNARHWNGWQAEQWMELIEKLKTENTVFVIIGADYDIGIPQEIKEAMNKQKIKYVDAIGQPLGVTIELLKRLTYFLGFPSGLSILNETLGKDGLMFYASNIAGIINTWADPERIKERNIKECLFCEPGKIFEWLKDEYKIFDKI